MWNIEGETLYQDGIEILSVRIEIITPSRAEEMLGYNVKNRSKKKHEISGIVRDMKNQRWKINGEPLCFDQAGVLRDGQNRLESLIRANATLPFVIVTAKEAENYDMGMSRTVCDILTIDDKITEFSTKNTHIVGVTTFAMRQKADTKYTKPEIAEVITKNREALGWYANSRANNRNKKGGRIITAPAGTAIVAAYTNGYPLDKLEHFIDVLCDGFSTYPEDKTVITLRNWLMLNTTATRTIEKDVYYRTQAALYNYLNNNIVTKSMPSKKEYYFWNFKEN